VDRELSAEELERLGAHLKECHACAARLEEIEDRARRVAECFVDLAEVPAAMVAHRRPSHVWRWAAAAIVAALALAPKGHEVAPLTPAAPPAPAIAIAEAAAPPPARPVHHRKKPRAAATYYLALDNDPIETGFVMRVALEGGMEADVIVDSSGRPRAIRPVNLIHRGER
jgi:hypothetical protein